MHCSSFIFMRTRNRYSCPVEKRHIQRIVTSEAPAHIRYHSDEHDSDYDMTNAVDFLCSTGTPIKAALNGKVVQVQDGLTKRWDKTDVPPKDYMPEDEQKGNSVVLKHGNNELSIYCHLKPGAIKVKPGDYVRAGDILGYNGHTGWSIKPHLHFMVFRFTRPWPARDFISLEIRWK
jgi:murein DD-endopeptidase MepM/ murein hydrolase activator NlpD